MTNHSSVSAFSSFYAKLVTGNASVRDPRIIAALEAVPREQFVGPGPWKVFALGGGYIETPSDDPAFLYQDVLIALSGDKRINNSQPSLHARCLAALGVGFGEAVLHIGAGTGYYTALLAHLVGPTGTISAYELDSDLARKASANLQALPNVKVLNRSGCEGSLEQADVIYVNAGATHPLDTWLNALRPNGRLLFPLTPDEGLGGMLLVTRSDERRFAARIVCPAAFIPCQGARDADMAQKLKSAFAEGHIWRARSLHRGTVPDEACCCAGRGWWLSTA